MGVLLLAVRDWDDDELCVDTVILHLPGEAAAARLWDQMQHMKVCAEHKRSTKRLWECVTQGMLQFLLDHVSSGDEGLLCFVVKARCKLTEPESKAISALIRFCGKTFVNLSQVEPSWWWWLWWLWNRGRPDPQQWLNGVGWGEEYAYRYMPSYRYPWQLCGY